MEEIGGVIEGQRSFEASVEGSVKLWELMRDRVPRPEMKGVGEGVSVVVGGPKKVNTGDCWAISARLGLHAGMDPQGVRFLVMLGLEFGDTKAEQIARDGCGLTVGLVAAGSKPWTKEGFDWSDTLLRNMKLSAFVRYTEACPSKQMRQLMNPIFEARWKMIREYVWGVQDEVGI